MLETRVREAAKDAAETGDTKVVDIAVEAMQRFVEYLETLETGDLLIDTSVVVKVDGKKIKFPGIEEVSEWITSNK